MKFEIKKQELPLPRNISDADVKLAEKFAKHLAASVNFVKGVLIDRTKQKDNFVPVLVLVDDLTTHLSKIEIDNYLKKLKKSINKTRLHVETIKFSEFWRLYKHKEPNFLELIREAVIVYDEGFMQPVKMLLAQGRIRPSREAIWTYYIRTNTTLKNSRGHLLQASLDLYWAVISVGHAALMKNGEIPPKPTNVATMLDEKFVKTKQLEKKYPEIMRKFYQLSRKILHKQITDIKGEEYDAYVKDAEDFITRIKPLLTYST